MHVRGGWDLPIPGWLAHFCCLGVGLHWVQLHWVHGKNGCIIPRRWHSSSCLPDLTLPQPSSTPSLSLLLHGPQFSAISSTLISHVSPIHAVHCKERLVRGGSSAWVRFSKLSMCVCGYRAQLKRRPCRKESDCGSVSVHWDSPDLGVRGRQVPATQAPGGFASILAF